MDLRGITLPGSRHALGLPLLALSLACSATDTGPVPEPVPQLSAEQWVEVAGRATALDVGGAGQDECDGFVRLIVHDQWGSSPKTLPVRAGSFELRALAGSNVEVVSLVLDGRWVEVEQPAGGAGVGIQGGLLLPVPADGRLVISGAWPAPVRVTVRGRPGWSKERLRDTPGPITVMSTSWNPDRTGPQTQVLLEEVESPFELPIHGHPAVGATASRPPEPEIHAVYWIRAPGYDWTQLVVDLKRGGDLVLQL